MPTAHNSDPNTVFELPTMSDRELGSLSKLIYDECGISLNSTKKSMLAARLGKRLRALGMKSFRDYQRFVLSDDGRQSEIVPLIDVVTTNTTEFFRESNHFSFLTQDALPKLVRSDGFAEEGLIRVWSAGCSSGEEPYTLAMVLSDFFEQREGDFSILATDISTRVLHRAKQAIYDKEQIAAVPGMMKRKYLMFGRDSQSGRVRLVPELRSRVEFQRLNFMSTDFGLQTPMDIIFCRNVLIYFDWPTKQKLIRRFYQHLTPGGYLFIGHSETLNGLGSDFVSMAPTVYRKPKRQEH